MQAPNLYYFNRCWPMCENKICWAF